MPSILETVVSYILLAFFVVVVVVSGRRANLVPELCLGQKQRFFESKCVITFDEDRILICHP